MRVVASRPYPLERLTWIRRAGERSPGRSASVITELTQTREDEQQMFRRRDLSGVDQVYLGSCGCRNSVHGMRPADTREVGRRGDHVVGSFGPRLVRVGVVERSSLTQAAMRLMLVLMAFKLA
jgi:hypothetical protein